ncbi:MAG TPA: glycerol-3-phosphate 1-O-acyltransferase PlsY [Candidatus Limnocylindria bacterium]|nr:glycerol-3-phosphate 1-O-acyltransferase PlsY [Candidatus Limnocylindria bacterium]
MTGIPGAAILVFLAYLIGALPFGLLIGRLAGGVDLREHGSGRTGATNALRTVGIVGAVLTFLLDLGKGVVAVLLVSWWYDAGPPGSPPWVAAAAGMAAVAGHIRSVFIGFRGGRGVATFTGAMLATAPWAVAILVPVVLLIVWRWRFVSLGSLIGTLLAPVVTAGLALLGQATWQGVVLAAVGATLVTIAHRDNIARLRAGTERRLGQ